jgi:hypothetical protein
MVIFETDASNKVRLGESEKEPTMTKKRADDDNSFKGKEGNDDYISK